MHPLAICLLTLTLKLSLKVSLVPYQKIWDAKPINCVGVQTFEHSELKFTNVRMLKFHIRLCLNYNMLTACDDEDLEAAIATAPLLGEKEDSMVNLVLVKNSEATVSQIFNQPLYYFHVVNSLRLLLHGTHLPMMLPA